MSEKSTTKKRNRYTQSTTRYVTVMANLLVHSFEAWCWMWTISDKATILHTALDSADACSKVRSTHLMLQLTGSQPRICSGGVTQDARKFEVVAFDVFNSNL